MKKCQAVKKDGNPCGANGAHIMMVWLLGAVAYPHDKLPSMYTEGNGWAQQAINVCGAHRNQLIGGKPINIIPMGSNQTSNTEIPTKPKEGIMNNKPIGCYCNGSGIDPVFEAPCKCTEEVGTTTSANGATDKQIKFITDLLRQIGDDFGTPKVSHETKSEASDAIKLLIQLKSLTNLLRNKQLSDGQKANIKAKLESPTIEWVKAATAKALTLPRKS